MKKRGLLSILVGMAVLSFTLFNSCEIGLGASVDVEAPSIRFDDGESSSNPPTSAIIRGAFTISGSWSDDGSISGMSVDLKNTDTKQIYSYSGSFSDSSWQCTIDPEKEGVKLPDGNYEATITISDNGGHASKISRSYVIDNTPPVIVLTRPSTRKDAASPDQYGQTFTLEGQAADTNNVSLIEVEIYSDEACTPESWLNTVELKNVPNSINMDVATFEKGNTENDYFKIYQDATTDGGPKDFYCKLIAYDDAKHYPADGSKKTTADEKGNPTSQYYLYKEIATEILQNYKINKVYEMLNGTFTEEDSSRTVSKADVLKKLSEKVNYEGKFTLNPKNNPTFSVTGRSPLLLDGEDFKGVANNISDGSQVVIEVSPGLDGILLEESSLKVYAIECEPKGKNGQLKAGAQKIYPKTTKSESGTSYRFVTTISRDSGFEINHTYLFGVEGYDQSAAKNPVIAASKGYGFKMAPSGKAPTLTVNTPSSPAYVKENGTVTFSGTVEVEAGLPELVLYKGNTVEHEFTFDEANATAVERGYVYNFNYSYSGFTGDSAEYSFKLVASQSDNASEYQPTITVLYAKGQPTLNTTIKGPLVSANIYPDTSNNPQNLDNINGDFDFEASISQKVGLYDVIDYDNSSWTFTGTGKDGTAKTETNTGKLAAAFAGKINTLNYKDKTIATLTFKVKDLAGNEKTETHKYFINQESDKPRFTATNFDKSVDTEEKLDERVALKKTDSLGNLKSNMFSSSQVMKFTVEDDDGIMDTKVKIDDGVQEDADGFTLPDGKSQLTFYVFDSLYDSTKPDSYNENHKHIFTVWVLKGQAPTVDILSSPDYVTTLDTNVATDAKKTFTITGTVSGVGEYTLSYKDPDINNPGNHKIYYKLTSEDDTAYTEVTKNTIDNLYHLYPAGASVPEAYKKSITWKDEFTPHSGSTSGTVQYTINGALNSTDKEFNFRVDSGRPTISWNADSVQTEGSTIYSTSYRFNGKAADSGISGLTRVEIQFTDKGGTPDSTKWMAADGTGDWYKNIYFANGEFSCFTTQSEKTIHVRAKDGAGNYSTIYTKDFKYDTEYPTITIDNKPNGYLPNGTYDLTGFITEKYGITNGTKLVVKEYLKSGTEYVQQGEAHELNITKGTGTNQYNYTWSMAIPFDSNLSGDLKYTFSISDANGNPLNAEDLLLKRDVVSPVVTITSPGTEAFGKKSISGTSATLTGSVKEKDKDKLYYQIQSDTTAAGTSWTEYDISDLANETDTWRVPVQLEESEYPAGKYTLYVKAKDKAGNESTAVSQYFSIDREDPKVTVTVWKKTGGNSERVTDKLSGSSTIKVASGSGYEIKIKATDDGEIESIKLLDITTSTTGETVNLTDAETDTKKTSTSITTEGTKSYKVIVKDNSGATTGNGKLYEETISVIYDKNDPTASIDTIENNNDWISGTGKVYISGEAKDNSGIKSIKMTLDDGTESTEKPVPVADPWTYELDCSSLTENTDATDSNYKLVLTVEDNCEKQTTVTRYFKLDKTTPVIKDLSVKNATTGAFTTSIKNVKASGLAFDGAQTGYRPVIVTIEAKNASGTQADIGGTNKVITVTTGSTHNTTFGQFNQAVATKDLADGEYTFTIKATDYAGNTAEQEAVITVDKTKPSVTATSFTDWNTTKSGATINATFTETNPDAAYYYIDNGSISGLTQETVKPADWVSMNIDGNTATKSCNFNDGKGKVYIKVVDKAGNVGYGTALDYAVDTKAPDVCTLESVKVKNGTNDYTELTGTKLINGSKDLVITVNATDYNDNYDVLADDPEKIKSITLNSIGSTSITGISGVKKTGKWEITIPSNKLPSAGGKVSVKVTDTFDNAKDFTSLVDLIIDKKAPRLLDNYSLTSTSAYDATAKDAPSKTYYMNNAKYPFKLEGIAKDDLTDVDDGFGELEEVKLTLTGTVGGVSKTKTFTSSDSAWTFEIANDSEADAWKNWTGQVTGTLSVTDKAKNTGTSKTFTIIFDTTAPAALHKTDDSGKDIYFRVGDQDRDDGITSINSETGVITATPAWNASLDKDVGGKYKSGTFGNLETIKIRGNFEETGSGIAMIYYKLFTTTTNIAAKITEFKNDPAGKADGYFSPKAASETTRRVFYTGTIDGVTATGSSGGKNYISIASTYLTTISGFKAGHNYLVLVAVDNVGNAAVDNITNGYYTINVDTQAPQTATFADKYIDGKSDLTLTLDVTDNPSGTGAVSAGIKSVTVKMDGVTETKPATKNESTGKYEATIPVAQIPASGTYNVSVTAIDGAGTPDTRNVGKVIVDKTPPTASLTSTSGFVKEAIANASISVSDTNGLKKNTSNKQIVTYNVYASTDTSYATSLATGTVEVGSDSVAKVTSIATTNTTTFQDGKSYIVRFTAEDIVGNKTYVNTGAYTIDRSGPAITDDDSGVGGVNKETAVEATDKWFNAETLNIFGKFTDAGCGVETIEYTLTPYGSTAINGSWSTADGTYSANLAGFKNGTNTLVLKAVDKLDNQSSEKTYTVKVDTSQPEISEKTNNDFKNITLTNGKSAKELEFYVTDSGSGINGEASISVKAGSSKTITNGINGSSFTVSEVSGQTNKWLVKVTLGATDLNSLTGNNSILVTITDKAGNKSNSQSIGTVNVDKDNPVPSFTSPQSGATVNKTITIKGTVTDASNSEITAVTLKANDSLTFTQVNDAWKAQTKYTINAVVYVEGEQKFYKCKTAHTSGDSFAATNWNVADHGYIFYSKGQWTATLDTTELYNETSSQALTLSLSATDEADNTSDANTTTATLDPVTLALTIDQNTDRPVVKFTNLKREGSGTVASPYRYILQNGDNATLEGTISDDDGTSDSVVKVFKASSTEFSTSDHGTTFTGATGTTNFTASTGDFKFTPSTTADGTKYVYFYIKDNNDNEFYTKSSSSQLLRPYQKYKDQSEEDNSVALEYMSDGENPLINYAQLTTYPALTINAWAKATAYTAGTFVYVEDQNHNRTYYKCKKAHTSENTFAATKTENQTEVVYWETITPATASLGESCVVGGPTAAAYVATSKNFIEISVAAKDDNGIQRIEITANGTTYKSTVASDGKVTTDSTSGVTTFTTNRIDLTSVAAGSKEVNVLVYDNCGLKSNQKTSFVIDRTAPDIDISTPASDGVTYYGTIKQNVAAGIIGGTDVSKVYFTVSEDPDLTDFDNGIDCTPSAGLSASIVFDGDLTSTANGIHTKNLHDWIKDLRPTTETQWANYNIDENDDNVPLYVYYKAIDTCGNFKVEKRLINVIPNGDKPLVKISYPENKLNASSQPVIIPALAGTIRLNGETEIQSYSVDSVYIQLAKYTHYTWGAVKNQTDATTKYYTDIAMTTHPIADGENKTLDDAKVYYFPETTWGAVKGNTLATQKAAMKMYYTNVVLGTHPDSSTADNTKVYTLDSTDIWSNWDANLRTLIREEDYNALYKDLIVDIPGQTGLKGIKASGTADNWNLPINTQKEFETGNIDMAIRVYAISNSGKDEEGNTKHKLSDPTDQLFTVDANAPCIGGNDSSTQRYKTKLVQFKENHEGELDQIISRSDYQDDMWVKGDWYLLTSVYDEQSGIKSIKLDEHNNVAAKEFITGTGTNVSGKKKYTITTSESKQAYAIETDKPSGCNYNICIPLPTGSDSGTVVYTIEVTEDTQQNLSSSLTLRVNYDNTAPKLGTIGHEHYNANAYNVHQNNGFYQLYGYATDSEAGKTVSEMKAIAFYFVRRGTDTKIFDPMWKNKTVTIATGETNNTAYSYEYGMFWQEKGVGLKTNTNNVLTLSAKDDFIHAGGFALIDGIIYTIDRVSTDGKEITVKSASIRSDIDKVKFAYALVIDNPGESIDGRGTKVNSPSSYGHGYYPEDTSRTADDGDLMYEKWASGKWEAFINSNNIPDGPIEIHYVALDNAQNYSVGIVGNVDSTKYKTYKTLDVAANGDPKSATNNLVSDFDYIYTTNKPAYISNNAPRIAGVTVAIDYTGTDDFNKAKQTTYYYQTGDFVIGGKAVKKPTAVTNLFKVSDDTTNSEGTVTKSKGVTTIKGKTWIIPEMVGGNGKLWYDYNIYASNDNGLKTTTSMKASATSTYFADGDEDYDDFMLKAGGLEYVNVKQKTGISHDTSTFLTSGGTGDATLEKPLWFDYTIYDSTEGETDLSKNQKATISIAMAVQVNDTTPPNTVVSPLFWNSSSENSVYHDDEKLYGHVEIKGNDITGTDLATYYNADDDKISGVVVFRGYAYDNKRLSELEWAIVSSEGKSILPNNANGISYTTGATFNGTWTGTSSFDIWTTNKEYAKDTVVFETSTKKFYKCSTAHTSGTTFDATNWSVDTSNHYKFTVKTEPEDDSDIFNKDGTEAYLDAKGHKVYWELIVDTSAINGTVAKDAKLYVRAKDASGASATQYTVMTGTGSTGSAAADETDQEIIDKATKAPTYQVDIVPYITGVETALKKSLKTSIVDAYTRTTLGHYIVREGEEVTFTGYNLEGAKYVKTKGTGNTADTTVNMTNGKLTVSNANISTSREILLKVGDLYTINNMNNNNAKGTYTGTISDSSTYNVLSSYAYNRMPNNKGNNLLTDDVYFDIWQFDADAATPVSGELREPAMKINPVTGKIGVAFVSGPADFSMPMGKNTDAADVSWQVFQHNYATFSNVALCYDSLGNSYGITTGLDTMPDGNKTTLAGRFTFQTSKWGTGNIDEKQDNYNGDNKLRLEAIGLPGDNQCYVKGEYPSKYTMTETRFYSPSIVATTHGNDTSVYLAYFDSVQGQIRFRYGKTVAGSKGDFDNFIDNTGINDSLETNSWWSDARKYVFEANTNAFSLIAGTDWQKNKTSKDTNNGYTNKVGTNYFYDTGFGAKKYVAIDAIQGTESSKDVVVAVWYDGKDCRYAYTTNPTSGKDNGKEGGWTGNKVIFSDGGEHCAIKVGPDGSIHIAANVDGVLKYAYLSSYNARYSETTDAVTVDSYAITGEKITIDVGRKAFTSGGTTTYKVVPYISYYLNSAKKPAVASLVIPSSGTMNYKAQGTDSSSNFTGNWDVSLVPVAETLTDLAVDKINVALWKKTVGTGNNAVTGVITGCTDNVFLSKAKTMANNAAGQCYGNGTSNPVIGYAIVTNSGTAFSLAQKK